MPMYGRFVPNYNLVRLYSLRGTVVGHGVRESGWWIFKNSMPTIIVRLRAGQLTAFNQLARTEMGTMEGNLKGIALVLALGMPEEMRSEYPVGTDIGITFGYSGPIEQFYFGNEPLKVMEQQVLRPGDRLVNEVVAAS